MIDFVPTVGGNSPEMPPGRVVLPAEEVARASGGEKEAAVVPPGTPYMLGNGRSRWSRSLFLEVEADSTNGGGGGGGLW